METNRYIKSEEFLKLAESKIPLGSQTFSKSKTQYPIGISPLFVTHAKGSKVYDLDGNEYIDLVNSLACITLGHADPEIILAVEKQLRSGSIYSLPSPLEYEVADLLTEIIPCADMVRFAKNGTDATSASIRLARAHTNKNHVIHTGYHGWQDWYIGSTTRSKGVPYQVSALSHSANLEDYSQIKDLFLKFKDDIACVIIEPIGRNIPSKEYLESIKSLCEANGALLIFDETITGFRVANGGAQELIGVVPHLATFGKGMANGLPLSAVVGQREYMMQFEDIFISGTFGGELLSLAAGKKVLERYINEPITEQLCQIGNSLSKEIETLIIKYELQNILSISGHDTWKFLTWSNAELFDSNVIRTYFMQEMFMRGVLVLGTHNVSIAIDSADILKVQNTYDEVLKLIREGLDKNSIRNSLQVDPLTPLFKLR